MNQYIKYIILLIIGIIIYSFTSIFSKMASMQEFLSFKYLIFVFLIILLLGIYAIIYQQVLRKIDLSVAMSFKPLALVFSILWAVIIFDDYISIKMIIGIVLIIIGIYIVGRKNEN